LNFKKSQVTKTFPRHGIKAERNVRPIRLSEKSDISHIVTLLRHKKSTNCKAHIIETSGQDNNFSTILQHITGLYDITHRLHGTSCSFSFLKGTTQPNISHYFHILPAVAQN